MNNEKYLFRLLKLNLLFLLFLFPGKGAVAHVECNIRPMELGDGVFFEAYYWCSGETCCSPCAGAALVTVTYILGVFYPADGSTPIIMYETASDYMSIEAVQYAIYC